MNYFDLETDERELHYGRFASDALKMLQEAVEARSEEGISRKQIAEQIEWDASQLSRLLNGRVKNMTLRTISDVLWAARFVPDELRAMRFEEVSPNHVVTFKTAAPDAEALVAFENLARQFATRSEQAASATWRVAQP